jgi:DNA-binding CsgD family transcriptional regulator
MSATHALTPPLNRLLADLFATLGEAPFCQHLVQLIRAQVSCDSVVMLLYHKGDCPKIILDEMSAMDRQAMQQSYFDGAYLLSPYYLHWLSTEHSDLVHLPDITPEGFFESVYYTDYYARSGLIDELGYIVTLADDSAILLSLGRVEGTAKFSAADSQALRALEPVVYAGLQRHFALYSPPPRQAMKDWLEDGLRLFGGSVLTEREQQVVQMMLRGYSSKSCAKALGISPATERVHRRHLYEKLGITSQAELFSLFFAAMSRESLTTGQDPLQGLSGQ